MSRFSYGAKLTPDEVDGGWVVTVRDIPEAITQGDDVESALREADDCLEEAIPKGSRQRRVRSPY